MTVSETGAAPPTIAAASVDPGSMLLFTAMPMGPGYLLPAALVIALLHGLMTRPGVRARYLAATRLLPPVLLAGAAIWVWVHMTWRIPFRDFEGFAPLGEPAALAVGLLLYGLGDILLLTAGSRARVALGATVGILGLVLLAIVAWSIPLMVTPPLTTILLILAVALASALAMIWLWRRLGGKAFGWLFVGTLVVLSFAPGGLTHNGFTRLSGAMLACGLASIGTMALQRLGRDGPQGMAGWGPWFATVLLQVMIATTALGAPTF